MKLTTSILLLAMTTGVAWAQNPDVIENTKNTLNAVAKKAEIDQNAVLNSSSSQTTKPAAGTVAKPQAGLKPAASTAKPASASKPATPTAAPTTKPAVVSVKPVTQPAKPTTPAAKAPVVAAKPATLAATPKPAGPANPAKPATPAVTAKPAGPATAAKPAGPATAAKPAAPATKAVAPVIPAQAAAKKQAPTKIAIAPIAPQPKQGAQKTTSAAKKPAKSATPVASSATQEKNSAKTAEKAAAEGETSSDTPKEKKTITAEGRRDPFVSPIVSRANGPACSTGKRCLAIDQIMVRGVVKSDNGMIAVVVNSLNKAYFLKENDPVYNGYVLRITGDSVVFKETYQDRLGKELQREVVKKITTPAV